MARRDDTPGQPRNARSEAVDHWRRDVWRYFWDLTGRRPFGGTFAIAGIVLAVISALEGHNVAIPAWGWLAIGLGAAVVAGFHAWRELSRRSITPEHAQRLNKIAEGIEHSLNTFGGDARYTLDGVEDPILRRQFRAHFDDLAVMLDELEEQRRNLNGFVTSRDNMLTKSAIERFPGEQGWDTFALLTCAKNKLGQYQYRDTAPRLDIRALGHLINWGPAHIYTIKEAESLDDRIEEVRQWFGEMWGSPEMRTLGERWELYEHSKRTVIGELHKVKYGDSYSLGGECEQCRKRSVSR